MLSNQETMLCPVKSDHHTAHHRTVAVAQLSQDVDSSELTATVRRDYAVFSTSTDPSAATVYTSSSEDPHQTKLIK